MKLGRANVDAMLREMTAIQWQEWLHYMSLAPFGEERDDYRLARVVQTLINMNRDVKKYPTPFTLMEIMNDLRFGDMPELLPPGPTRLRTGEHGSFFREMVGAYTGQIILTDM